MDWLEITINSLPEKLDELCMQLEEHCVSGLIINDEASMHTFLEQGKQYWDYVDEEVYDRIRGVCSVQFYLEDSESGKSKLERISALVPGEYSIKHVKDEDWENNWREYYKPIMTGNRLIIVPEWEEIPHSDRVPLRLDPGLIFGTGAHPTTQMCLEELEKHSPKTALDLGCGSGILGIAAVLLGADRVVGCDIDEKAPKVVMENGALNDVGEDRLKVYDGDVLSDAKLNKKIAGKYDVVLANIVADVIIALTPKVDQWLAEDGVYICSGIIEGRQDEVADAIKANGFEIVNKRHIDDWYCFTAAPKKEK